MKKETLKIMSNYKFQRIESKKQKNKKTERKMKNNQYSKEK